MGSHGGNFGQRTNRVELSEWWDSNASASAATEQVATSQPEFGGAKCDVGSTIVSILEVAESGRSGRGCLTGYVFLCEEAQRTPIS